MQVSCPRCKTWVEATPGTLLTCPTCAFAAAVPAAASAWRPVTPPAAGSPAGGAPSWSPAGQGAGMKKPDMGLAVAALLLNVLLLPGLGSIIGGRTQEGIWQLALGVGSIIVAFVLFLTIVGILLLPVVMLAPLAAWVWGLITGIQLVQRAS